MKPLPSQLVTVLPLLALLNGITNAADPSEPVPEYVLPEPPGRFKVKHDMFEIVDKSRLDPFDATHFRRLMVSRFDPVEDCEICNVPYMPPATARLEHEILLTVGPLPRLLEPAKFPVCCNDNDNNDEVQNAHDPKFPLLVFSAGYNTTRFLYSATAQAVASAGFTVFTVDHPYLTDIVEFPDGSIITGGIVAYPPEDPVEAAWCLDVRAADMSFVIDRFSRHHPAGVFGHSFGGAAAATTIAKDLNVAGGVNLDGMQFGRVVKDGFGSDLVRQAFMLFGSEGHNTSTAEDPSWGDFWKKMHEPPHDKVWTRELTMHPSMHGSYWDFGVLLDASGVGEQMDKEVRERFAGPMEGKRVMEILHAYVGGFFGFILKGEDDSLFDGPNEKFPEVEIIPYAG